MSTTEQPTGLPEYLPVDLDATIEPSAPGELLLRVDPGAFERAARTVRALGARFVTVFIATAPERSLIALLALRGELIALRVPLETDALPAECLLGNWWPAARWAELELLERHGLADDEASSFTKPNASALERTVSGLDVFPLPYGPVRSGVFEAIQFQIETGGEDVLRLQTRPFFKHRGLERRMIGMSPDRAVYVAERTAGIASVAYACAFSDAVERASGVAVPRRAQRWRALHAELERTACHLDVIAKEAETTALFVGQARFQILKENVMRMRAELTGSRFARGVIAPGGVRDEPEIDVGALLSRLDRFEQELRRDRRLFLGTASMTDRLIGAGHLDRAVVEDFGAVGPLARGSGLSTDARHERPYGDYARLGLQVVTAGEGDSMARVRVRFGELSESIRLLRQGVEHLRRSDGPIRAPVPDAASGAAFGWAEAPQGELMIWVALRDGLISDVHIASPSLRNWALFEHAFPKDVLTDFAFIEHSFGLTPAGADR